MKKRITKILLPLMATVLLLAGCGRDVELSTTYFTIQPGEWSTQENLGYAYAEKQFPELTDNVINGGAVMVYYIDENGYDNQLPYLLPYSQMDDQGNEGLYFENIRYDLRRGWITFIVQQNDNYVILPSKAMKFKVCILENR